MGPSGLNAKKKKICGDPYDILGLFLQPKMRLTETNSLSPCLST